VLKQFFTDKQIQAMTPQLNPDSSTGLDYYPLPATGERFPVNDVHFKPQLEPRPSNDIEFFQGLLEGIAKIETKGYQLLAELGAPYPVSVRTTGGGAKNSSWAKIRSTMMNTKLICADQTEAAYGAALLAKSSVKLK
jgi:sugar (pentulose or hexulose) kinase